MTRCKFTKPDGYICGSYAFNLRYDGIDQGDRCDVHYWQDRALKAEAAPADHWHKLYRGKCQELHDERARLGAEIEALEAEPAAATAEQAKRGTEAQILFERRLTCEAIDGAMAFGYQNTNPPPTDDHWLKPYWDIGLQSHVEAALLAKQGEAVPAAWFRVENGMRVYYGTNCWPDLTPLYLAAPAQPAERVAAPAAAGKAGVRDATI